MNRKMPFLEMNKLRILRFMVPMHSKNERRLCMSVPCSRDPFPTTPLTWQGERDLIGPVRGLDAQCAQKIRRILSLALLALWSLDGLAAEFIPPKPAAYFNDYAGVVSTSTAHRLNQTLEDFEKSTSSQVVVAVFRSLEGESLEDFSIRLAQAWRIGRKGLDNGVILLVFIDDRKMRIEVGYGLEGNLTDAVSSSILRDVVAPRFREKRIADGIGAGLDAIDQAIAGTYQRPAPARRSVLDTYWTLFLSLFFVGALLWVVIPALFMASASRRRGWTGGSSGWGGPFIGGGGWSGGGGGSGDGGGFSGGGGSFGGGGASGSW